MWLEGSVFEALAVPVVSFCRVGGRSMVVWSAWVVVVCFNWARIALGVVCALLQVVARRTPPGLAVAGMGAFSSVVKDIRCIIRALRGSETCVPGYVSHALAPLSHSVCASRNQLRTGRARAP
jgi:hypothetical protein